MGNGADDARLVADAVTKYIGSKENWPRSSGYGERIDLALINAVMSIQARFGSQLPDGSFNGLRGAVERYRAAHADLTGDWFQSLAAQEESALLSVLTRSKFKTGKTKAAAVIEAAQAFLDAGFKTREGIIDDLAGAEKAYRSVSGLGPWTFQYFTMLLGVDSVKPDIWITRFVSRTVRHEVSASTAFEAVSEAAELLETTRTELDHAIWAYGNTSGLRDMPKL
ncbi:hypothetical protein [Sinomonas gamaensis]|uniref:hypothetical protein n=1 Tax=Sinomonas gamaensis TaxID=2565624 RepID=UPI0011093FF9|nr:hypothetical protein [Sinomonas gamaensis]